MYFRSSCSPYDVQANQGGRFTFDTIKKQYDDTVPLRGKRKDQNIRPIKRRDRAWERIIKVSDTEYYITFDAYQHRQQHNKAISWCLNDGMETMTVHTPRKMWGTSPSLDLNPREFSSSSVYWFYDFNLPHEFSMANHRANKYLRYQDKYYSVELGDVVFQRKQGESQWQPLIVHREFKHTLDRTKTKQLRETIKPFMAYYDIMCDMVDSKWDYGNPIVKALNDGENGAVKPSQAIELFKPNDDGNVPDAWLKMVEQYKHKITRSYYDRDYKRTDKHERNRLSKEICNDLFRIARPCKVEEVPIGKLVHDRYKWWYR